MAIDPATLREEALRLPTEARVRLVAELLVSLDHDEEASDEEIDEAWNAEIAERLRAVDAGEIKPVPWNGRADGSLARTESLTGF
jgi:putative addiction module component (TIGR02574 family)